MKLRRNLSGIFIFDKLEGEEKPIPTCIEDCTPETKLKWLADEIMRSNQIIAFVDTFTVVIMNYRYSFSQCKLSGRRL